MFDKFESISLLGCPQPMEMNLTFLVDNYHNQFHLRNSPDIVLFNLLPQLVTLLLCAVPLILAVVAYRSDLHRRIASLLRKEEMVNKHGYFILVFKIINFIYLVTSKLA